MANVRSRLLIFALIGVILCAVFLWYQRQMNWTTVSDARIAGNLIKLSSETPGRIVEMPAAEGMTVSRGQTLLQLDTRSIDSRLRETSAQAQAASSRYSKLQAELALMETATQQQVDIQAANLTASKASLEAAIIEADIRRRDWERNQSLVERNLVSQSDVDLRRATYRRANELIAVERARTEGAREALAEATANLARGDILRFELEALAFEQEQIEARRKQLRDELEDSSLVSPVDGVIDQVFVNGGERLLPGQRILMLHDPDDLWVSANVKETRIRHVQPGARVKIRADAFPDREFEGSVRHIGQATTNQFALIPAPNPSGNFTKITQRVNVRIDLSAEAMQLLNPGMMVVVDIARP